MNVESPMPWAAQLAQSPAEGQRAAALALHAMSEGDRAWTLGQLSASQQSELQALIAEIDALGVSADAQVVEQALLRHAEERRPAPKDRLVEDVDRLAAVVVGRVLSPEPSGLIRRVIDMRNWSWRAQVGTLLAARLVDGTDHLDERVDAPTPIAAAEASALTPFDRRLLELLLQRAGCLRANVRTTRVTGVASRLGASWQRVRGALRRARS